MRSAWLLAGLVVANFAHAGTLKQTVDGVTSQNYFVAPKEAKKEAKKAVPGIVILPEWWGLSDFERGVADRLAAQGYAVLVADLYGEGRLSFDPDVAAQWMQETEKDEKLLNRRFSEALNLLHAQPHVDSQRTAVVGFGFGGGLALDQARLGLPLKGVINYYGGVSNEARIINQPIKAEILELVGSRDEFTPASTLADLRSEMKAAHVKLQIEVFKDAYQSFPNKLGDAAGTKYRRPFQYDAKAEARAWKLTTEFLRRVLK